MMETETDMLVRPCPAGFTVLLDGKWYGIGSTLEAAYDMARNDRTGDRIHTLCREGSDAQH